MKDKDLVIFYKAFSNLYGAILDKDAFKIIKHYFPDFTYEEFEKDIKKRLRKPDRTYSIRKWDKDSYVIRSGLNNKETKQLFFWQEKKPYFIPKTYEELKTYIYYGNINRHTDDIIRKISKLCLKYVTFFDEEFSKTLAFALAEDTQLYVLKHLHSTDVLNHMKEANGINFSLEDEKEYLKLYEELRLQTRTWEDCGFTNKEINEHFFYDELFRPVLNFEEDNFLEKMQPKDIDVNLLVEMVDKVKTFDEKEKEIVKKTIKQHASGIVNIAA